jgi:hypothetical protein
MRTMLGRGLLTFLFSSLCVGCLERTLDPLSPCLVSNVVDQVHSRRIDKVDLLFMVDNSSSMQEEQASLKDQFPKLIRALTTGDRDGNGTRDFEPATDLHIGVVSSDLGLPGVTALGADSGCSGVGDDGIMSNTPSADITGCQASYPRFLSYLAGRNDPDATAHDFACIAQLGTNGCGYEQQLEAPLKALWPAVDPMPDPATGMNRVTFFTDASRNGLLGHGDRENKGFLRDDAQGSSLLAIVLVTDEDDCSSQRTDDIAGLAPEQLDLRCFLHKDALFSPERYVTAYQALRPGHPELVVFAAIAGVPKDLVDSAARAGVKLSDAAQRDAYYQRILQDQRMQETPDVPAAGSRPQLLPSCRSAHGLAAPPRRIVQVAQGFGENGIVQSVCQDDFGPAMDAIVELIGNHIGSVCVPHKQVRNSDGLVGCNVVWQLPAPDVARPGTPTQCQSPDFPFLSPLDPGDQLAVSVTGVTGATCTVAQLRVVDDPSAPDAKKPAPTLVAGQMLQDGWYYDDYSAELKTKCMGGNQQRLAFTTKAAPPNGVTVHLECLDERQSLPMQRTDVRVGSPQPSIGDACDDPMRDGQSMSRDAACEVQLSAPTASWPEGVDRSMFCHPKQNLCVRACSSSTDCAPAWVCDDRTETLLATASAARPNGSAICVNPTCGGGR